jgi:hypothetical protein
VHRGAECAEYDRAMSSGGHDPQARAVIHAAWIGVIGALGAAFVVALATWGNAANHDQGRSGSDAPDTPTSAVAGQTGPATASGTVMITTTVTATSTMSPLPSYPPTQTVTTTEQVTATDQVIATQHWTATHEVTVTQRATRTVRVTTTVYEFSQGTP